MKNKKEGIKDVILKSLDSLGYNYQKKKQANDSLIVHFPIQLENNCCELSITWNAKIQTLSIVNLPYIKITSNYFRSVTDYVTTINAKLKLGAFVLSKENNEFYLRISFVLNAIDESSLIKNIDLSCLLLERYIPEVVDLISVNENL